MLRELDRLHIGSTMINAILIGILENSRANWDATFSVNVLFMSNMFFHTSDKHSSMDTSTWWTLVV